MAEKQGVSLKPSDAKEGGGGLIDNIDAVAKEVKFTLFDYQGKAAPVPAIYAKLVDREDNEFEQYWSMGSAKDWVPSADGKTLVASGTAEALNAGSNGMIMITSLVNAGFPEDKLGDDISVLTGLDAHWSRVAAPKRTGIAQTARADGKTYEQTILCVDKINKLPWDKLTPTAKGGRPKGGKKEPPPEEGGETDPLEEAVKATVMGLVAAGAMDKTKVIQGVYAALKSNPQDAAKAVQLVNNDSWLKAGPWKYEGGKVSLG